VMTQVIMAFSTWK